LRKSAAALQSPPFWPLLRPGLPLPRKNVDVDANGGMQPIYTMTLTYADTCNSAAPPTFKIKQSAKNGRLIADIVRSTFLADHKSCAGKPAQVFVVGYQPKRGFRGKDMGVVSMRFNAYSNENIVRSRALRFNINVK
jgi:hypothetical protein